jgi:D-aminoacyl-tRNA deacylase
VLVPGQKSDVTQESRSKSSALHPLEGQTVNNSKQNFLTADPPKGWVGSTAEDFRGRVLIVSSAADPASQNITRNLILHHGFVKDEESSSYLKGNVRLVEIGKICVYAEPSDLPANYDSIIFASKHVSSTGRPALTVHTTGNLDSRVEFGGRPLEVSHVDPTMIRKALRALRDGVTKAGLDIDVTMEATHHGPTSFQSPVCFVEVGSGPKEWEDPRLGRIAADAIVSAATKTPDTMPTAVGFGGTHYAAKHTRVCLDGGYQIGHVVPKYALDIGVPDNLILDTIRKTEGSCATAVIDWKGVGGPERRRLVETLEGHGYEAVRG